MTPEKPQATPILRYAVLAAGDAAVFVAFALIGLANHQMTVTAGVFLRTVAPFALAWFALSPWLGAYRQAVTGSAGRSLWQIPLVWLVCGVVGLLARLWLFDRPWLVSFAVVALVGQAILLVGWRLAYALVNRGARPRSATA